MRFRFLLLAVVASVLPVQFLYPDSDNLEFERVSLRQGLSQTSVFSIVQDHQGFLWFGTQDGLNKYDGYRFIVFHRDIADSNSISDNYITVLCVDKSGTLWAGTKGGGLNRFVSRTQRFIHYRHNPLDTTSLSSDEIVCLCEDRNGALWVGTPNGLNKFDTATGRCIHFRMDRSNLHSLSNDYIESLYEDHAGRLWIGMIDGSAYFDPERRSIVRTASTAAVSLFDSFAEDDDSTLWAATPQNILNFAHGRWQQTRALPSGNQMVAGHVLLTDSTGVLWIGSNSGLYRLNSHQRRVEHYFHDASNPNSLSGNAVLSLFLDRTGILWAGTYEGINKFAPRSNRFEHVAWRSTESDAVGWNKIRTFCGGAAGDIWVGTQQGLATYDLSSKTLRRVTPQFPYPKSGGTDLIWSLAEERNEKAPTIWIGTNGNGLVKLTTHVRHGVQIPTYSAYTHHDGNQRSLSGNVVFTILESRSGDLWLGTLMEGLDKFDKRTGVFTTYKNDPNNPRSIDHNEIWSLCEDRTGTLWIGTAGGGINKLLKGSNEFEHFVNDPLKANSLSDNKVLAIFEDDKGILWIGTYAGLNRFDPSSEVFTRFSMKDGLPDDVVYGIEEDKNGCLWLSTNKGISKFDPRTETFRNYYAGDGLQSDEFNHGAVYKSEGGELFFGGINGFNVFRPGDVIDNPTIPQLVFTDFKVFDKSVSPSSLEHRIAQYISEAGEIHLSYKDAVFSLEFSALEYTNPAKNSYAYMMEGFDKTWRYAGFGHEATYTNLDPGAYLFRVKASNNDGVWNEEGASIRIYVTPPYWQTWWFRLSLIASFVSVGPILYFRRVAMMRKEQEFQRNFSQRLIESQESERKRIAGELHDSIGQDLLIIKNKLLLGMKGDRGLQGPDSEVNQAIDYVSRSLKSVREISRNLRPVQLDQLGLTAALESVVETVADSSSIAAEVKIDNVDNLLDKQAEISFYRIVQECLNNILKHSNATKFAVTITRTDKTLHLKVADNGRGMGTDQSSKRGFGMTGMDERARILGGSLQIESIPGDGTTVSLAVPLG